MCEAHLADVAQALAYASIFNGRKRARDADGLMAEIVADRLVKHLQYAVPSS